MPRLLIKLNTQSNDDRGIALRAIISLIFLAVGSASGHGQTSLVPARQPGQLRIATYNVSLNRPSAGQLANDLESGDSQAKAVAAVIRTVRPDVLLVNELDYSSDTDNARLFAEKYLADETIDALGNMAWPMPYHFAGPVNTGVPSGLDLNNNGQNSDPEDAWGYGRFPGQYGMAILSRFPFSTSKSVRTFQLLPWSSMPNALRPKAPESSEFYYSESVWNQLRLSSKSFWDAPLETPLGTLHVLASHPTPPAFDGPEDRNGCRNHDEIRLITDYIDQADYLVDDQGQAGGLPAAASFVVLGDLNCDPVDGNSRSQAIRRLLAHPKTNDAQAPASRGGVLAAVEQGGANAEQQGPAAQDTGDFNDRSVGNLRVDYAIPSNNFEVLRSGVFWPELAGVPAPQREPLEQSLSASDHHLVWIDIRPKHNPAP